MQLSPPFSIIISPVKSERYSQSIWDNPPATPAIGPTWAFWEARHILFIISGELSVHSMGTRDFSKKGLAAMYSKSTLRCSYIKE